NGVAIEVHVSSYKSVRGRTAIAVLCDEVCFWKDDYSSNPADAVIEALRPSLSTIPGSLLLCASSTYTQTGVAFDTYAAHHGKDASNILVWQADTATMNPSFDPAVIADAYARDALDAGAEYGSDWLTHVYQLLPGELIDAATVIERRSLARMLGTE